MQGDHARSAELFSQVLAIRREIGGRSGICVSAACAAATLAASSSSNFRRPAAIAYYAALARAAELNYRFEPEDLQVANDAGARLDAAAASGEISAEQLAAWKAEGEAMSFDELAEFVLAELERLRG